MVNLSEAQKKEIVQAIADVERRTSAEIRVHLQKSCKGDAMKRAEKFFVRLGMHKTKRRNGVLIYLALESHVFAIVGDKGIHEKVGQAFWQDIQQKMTYHFKNENIQAGILQAIQLIGGELIRYFPCDGRNPNELSNEVSVK